MYKRNSFGINEPLNYFQSIIVEHTIGILIFLLILIAIGVLFYCLMEGFMLNKVQITVVTILVVIIVGSYSAYAINLHHQVNEYNKFEDNLK